MLPLKLLLCVIFIVLSAVDANPSGSGKVTLSLTLTKDGNVSIATKDRARAQAMKQVGQLGGSIVVTNDQQVYTTVVGVGTPPANYTLVIDTGSSNTFVGTGKAYVPTSSSRDTGNNASVRYGSGSWSGEEWIDTVTLGPDLVIYNQSIGVANTSVGFTGSDGILGVGPIDLTNNTVSNTSTVPTVMNNLVSQGTISEEVLGIYFKPYNDTESSINGELTFGGYDSSKILGHVDYVPLTTTSRASRYWGIDQSITYGNNTILSSTAGIVDTGTTLILIATDAFQRYQSATGGILDSSTGLLSITESQYEDLQSLFFDIGSRRYELTPNGQIWPRSINTAIGGSSNSIYLIVNDIGTVSGLGLDFVVGYTFLERYYSVYDTTNQRVGFALTPFSYSMSN